MDSLSAVTTQNVKEMAFRVKLTGLEVSLGNLHWTTQGKESPNSSLPASVFHELPEVGKGVTGNSIRQETINIAPKKWAAISADWSCLLTPTSLELHSWHPLLSELTSIVFLEHSFVLRHGGVAGGSMHSLFTSLLETEGCKAWISLCASLSFVCLYSLRRKH